MLIPNLAVLLAERRLTISKVSADTGISRTTLTALAGHSARGVQFDTLNALCQYLKVAPGDLFIYLPFDLSLSSDGLPGRSVVELLVTRAGGAPERYRLQCDAQYRRAPGANSRLEALCLRLSLPGAAGDAPDERSNELETLLKGLPRPVLAQLELQLLRQFDRRVDPALAPDDYRLDLRWPWQ